jgi:HSP20 family protein
MFRKKRGYLSEKKDEMCYCSEVSYGSFERAVSIPTNIDTEKVAAQYKNGVLVITLPKREEAKPKKIEVKVK